MCAMCTEFVSGKQVLILCCYAWMLLVTVSLERVFAHGESTTHLIAHLFNAYTDNFGSLKSLRVHYLAYTEYDNRDSIVFRYVDVDYAVKTKSRYFHLTHGRGGTEAKDPREGISICDGESFNVFRPYPRRYETSRRFAKPPYTDKIYLNLFIESMGWWPNDSSKPPGPSEYEVFISRLLTDNRYRVLQKHEVIQSIECYVIELAGVDRLWFDGDRGILIKRQLFSEGQERPRLFATIELNDYRRVDPGVWLPFSIRRQLHATSEVTVMDVQRYRTNDVPDELFCFVPPPGTLVYNRDNDQGYQVPGGLEFLEECVNRAQRLNQVSSAYSVMEGLKMVACFVGGFIMYCVVKHRVWRWGYGSLQAVDKGVVWS